MHYSILQLRELRAVPAVRRTYQVARDPLERVDVMSVTMRTFRQVLTRILISAVKTPVAVMVYAAVTDIVLVHKVHDIHDGLRIVRRIPVNLHIEYMSAPLKLMIRPFDLRLMLRSAMEINRNVT